MERAKEQEDMMNTTTTNMEDQINATTDVEIPVNTATTDAEDQVNATIDVEDQMNDIKTIAADQMNTTTDMEDEMNATARSGNDQGKLSLSHIPDVPMRIIINEYLKYGDHSDIFALRLVSKHMKQIIDSHIELVWSANFDNPWFLDLDQQQMLENSDRDIHVNTRNMPEWHVHRKKFMDFIKRFSHRIYRISNGLVWLDGVLMTLRTTEMPNLEHMHYYISIKSTNPILQLNFFLPHLYNLKHLELSNVRIISCYDKDVALPCLETLILRNIGDYQFFRAFNLLACAYNLKKLEIHEGKSDYLYISAIKLHHIKLKKLKSISVSFQEQVIDLPGLLATCSPNLERLRIQGGAGGVQWCTQKFSLQFPRLSRVILSKVDLKPFLPLLESLGSEEVELEDVVFTNIKGVQENVTCIKHLFVNANFQDDESSEGNFGAMFEFLGNCCALVERIVINSKNVDKEHLLPENLESFKKTYVCT